LIGRKRKSHFEKHIEKDGFAKEGGLGLGLRTFRSSTGGGRIGGLSETRGLSPLTAFACSVPKFPKYEKEGDRRLVDVNALGAKAVVPAKESARSVP
jgi:hypothetical protein